MPVSTAVEGRLEPAEGAVRPEEGRGGEGSARSGDRALEREGGAGTRPSLRGGRLSPGRGLPPHQPRPPACGQRRLQPVGRFSSGWLCFSDPLAASPHALRQSLDPRHSGCASDECGLPFLGGGFGRSHAGCSFLPPITSWWRALWTTVPCHRGKGAEVTVSWGLPQGGLCVGSWGCHTLDDGSSRCAPSRFSSLDVGCRGVGRAPSKVLREKPFVTSLIASQSRRHSSARGHMSPISASVFIRPSSGLYVYVPVCMCVRPFSSSNQDSSLD